MNQRLSNIELLRSISMFMVLLLHSSFLAYGIPESKMIESAPTFWGGQNFTTRSRYCSGRCFYFDFRLVFYKTKNHKHLQLFISNILFEVFKSDYLCCIRKSTLLQRYIYRVTYVKTRPRMVY